MQKLATEIQKEVIERIRKEFLIKFNGNNRQFAKSAGCDEKTIRLIFDGKHGMTLNLFFKLAAALELKPSKLIDGLEIKKEV